jgi:hypothetical protein
MAQQATTGFGRPVRPCHACPAYVDNRIHPPCDGCGWRICPNCGSCLKPGMVAVGGRMGNGATGACPEWYINLRAALSRRIGDN